MNVEYSFIHFYSVYWISIQRYCDEKSMFLLFFVQLIILKFFWRVKIRVNPFASDSNLSSSPCARFWKVAFKRRLTDDIIEGEELIARIMRGHGYLSGELAKHSYFRYFRLGNPPLTNKPTSNVEFMIWELNRDLSNVYTMTICHHHYNISLKSSFSGFLFCLKTSENEQWRSEQGV